MSTLNQCFVLKYEKYQSFLSENFQFLEVKFIIYLNRHVFVMTCIHIKCKIKLFQHKSISTELQIMAYCNLSTVSG